MSRMPPPSCTGMVDARRGWRATAAPFTGRPANAPFRSTTCSQAKPAVLPGARLRAGVVGIDRRLRPSRRGAAARTRRPSGRWRDTASGSSAAASPPSPGLQQLVVEEARGSISPAHQRVVRMHAPAHVAEQLVKRDRRRPASRARPGSARGSRVRGRAPPPLGQQPRQPVAARVGGDEARASAWRRTPAPRCCAAGAPGARSRR